MDQQELQTTTRRFKALLQEDRRQRVSTTGVDIESLIATGHTIESCSTIQRWYQKAKVHPPPPTREGMEHTSTRREDIYRQRPLEGKAVPILLQPSDIPGGPPEGNEISVLVRVINKGRAGGP